ncbi:MAG: lactonase family protein [Cyclobacteriaceae bacterium]
MTTLQLISKTLILLTLALINLSEAVASKEYIYIGTFKGRESEGIYVYEFNRNDRSFTQVQVLKSKESPGFLSIHPTKKYLYAVNNEGVATDSNNGSVSAFKIDPASGKLELINEVSAKGKGPCHISIDPKGEFAYVSNYSSGSLVAYRILGDGSLSEATDVVQHEGSSINPSRQKEPHMHSAIPSTDGKFIFASDLGIDKIAVYQIIRQSGKLEATGDPGIANPGAGPRHFTIHPGGKFAYSAEELTSTVSTYAKNKSTGSLSAIQHISMLPDDYQGLGNSAADIHTSPDGKFLYASNRGHDSLVIYEIDQRTGKLSLIGHSPTLGGHPRNFCMDSQGEFVLVANRDADNVVLFERDKTKGTLSPAEVELNIPMAVCVIQLILP